jgi:organic hydroperoxide reductase OsmC/OhrA
MLQKTHHYTLQLNWTGNKGVGTSAYDAYTRDHEFSADGKKIVIPGSSDPSFRGDPTRYNPEELLLASLSSCHMLWFLHLCSTHKIQVIAYEDEPVGTMLETKSGSGHFTEVILRPRVKVATAAMLEKITELHHEANKYCFIANSVNFPVRHEGETEFVTM